MQLSAEGLTRTTIGSWLRCQRLVWAWPEVYAVGHIPRAPQSRAFGAVLAAGDRAAIARWSALAFYGAVKYWPGTFELVTPVRCRTGGLDIRRSTTLLTRDIWRYDGLAVTSPARTALDIAPSAASDRLSAIIDHLRLRHGLTLHQLRDVIARNPRHPGAAPLRRLIHESGKRASRSRLERSWRQRTSGQPDFPPFVMNERVAGYEVDVLVDGLVIVEIDTFATHLLNFDSDRRRDADILARTGIPTVRVTDEQLDANFAAIAAQIVAIVESRRAQL